MKSNLHLIIILGLPGTGKSTFAVAIAKKIKATHLNTDEIRTQLGLRSKYDLQTKSSVYQELLSRSKIKLKENQNVVVDATFSKNEWRKKFHDLADEFYCRISWIVIAADEAVIRERVSKKRQYSEADFGVYKKVRDGYDLMLYPHLVLYSDQYPMAEMTKKAMKYLNRLNNNS